MLMDNYFDFLPVFENYGHYYVRTENAFVKVPSNLKDFVTFDVLPRMDRLLLSQTLTKGLYPLLIRHRPFRPISV